MKNIDKSNLTVRRDGASRTRPVEATSVRRDDASTQSPPVYFERAVSRRDINTIMDKLAKL